MCNGCLLSSRPFLVSLSGLLVLGNLRSRIHFQSNVNPGFLLWEDRGSEEWALIGEELDSTGAEQPGICVTGSKSIIGLWLL